jgi:rubrerythrin
MVLSREEIEQIAKRTADEVVNKLQTYAPIYEDPATVEEGLASSMQEELIAAEWYEKRATHALQEGDDVTYELYQHIAQEERGHREEYGHRLHELALAPK